MTVRQTSLLVYFDEVVPTLGEKQSQVLKAIQELGQCTDKQIATHLGWPINCICNRRGELFQKGLILEAGLVKNESNRTVMSWRVV